MWFILMYGSWFGETSHPTLLASYIEETVQAHAHPLLHAPAPSIKALATLPGLPGFRLPSAEEESKISDNRKPWQKAAILTAHVYPETLLIASLHRGAGASAVVVGSGEDPSPNIPTRRSRPGCKLCRGTKSRGRAGAGTSVDAPRDDASNSMASSTRKIDVSASSHDLFGHLDAG